MEPEKFEDEFFKGFDDGMMRSMRQTAVAGSFMILGTLCALGLVALGFVFGVILILQHFGIVCGRLTRSQRVRATSSQPLT